MSALKIQIGQSLRKIHLLNFYAKEVGNLNFTFLLLLNLQRTGDEKGTRKREELRSRGDGK